MHFKYQNYNVVVYIFTLKCSIANINDVKKHKLNWQCKLTCTTNDINLKKLIKICLHVASGLSFSSGFSLSVLVLAGGSLSAFISSETSLSGSVSSGISLSAWFLSGSCLSALLSSPTSWSPSCFLVTSVTVSSVDWRFGDGLWRDLLFEGFCLVRGLLLPTSEIKRL